MSVLKIHNALLTYFFGIWLIFPKTAGVLILLILVCNLVGWLQKENTFKSTWKFLPWYLLFAAYVVASFLSPDLGLGLSELERKLSLIAFPLIFSFQWKVPIRLNRIWLIHVIACLILVVLAFYDAWMCSQDMGHIVRCFSTSYFSQIHHPTYFSAFLIFAIIGLIYNEVDWFNGRSPGFRIILIVLFSAIHLNVGSLGGILSLLLIFSIYFFHQGVARWGRMKALALGVVGFSALFLMAYANREIRADIQNALSFTEAYLHSPSDFIQGRHEPLQGNEVRLILWTASFNIVGEHPFGLGMGQLDQAMAKQLNEWGYPQQAKKNFNPHNQWLQITNELGILGLLIAVFLLWFAYQHVPQDYKPIFTLFLLCFVVLSSFESVLQRQSGIVFFLSWMAVFIAMAKPNFDSIRS